MVSNCDRKCSYMVEIVVVMSLQRPQNLLYYAHAKIIYIPVVIVVAGRNFKLCKGL